FGAKPTAFEVKRGDPGTGASDLVSSPYVTREYQVCMKCHSNYSYDTPPALGSFSGGTPPGIAGVTSNGAELSTPPAAGYSVDFQANNHRSWHPVMNNTGREPAVRGVSSPNIWLTPFNAAVGQQTMYCTDCHGNDTEPGTVIPTGGVNGNVWGPHGSENVFLLKGPWSNQTGSNRQDDLCFKCHDYSQYGRIIDTPGGNNPVDALESGFKRVTTGGAAGSCIGGSVETNAHLAHGWYLGTQPGNQPLRCTYCHVAVPHGWKNKVFLANLNDVGLEAGLPSGTQVRNKTEARYYKYPYYNGAVLKVRSFARSGEWLDTNCGSAGPPGNGIVGSNWMRGSGGNSEACTNPP
ncbi:MAG: Doubled CXXCH motif-containing protein, partial [Halothiobacillaceae bacterium]